MPIRDILLGWSVAVATTNLAIALANTRSFAPLVVDDDTPVAGPVVVCVPARDEDDRIADLVADLRAQRDLPDLTVLIYDDSSTDDTAAVARTAIGDDPRLTVVTGHPTPTPPGWTGKAWALHRLTETLDGDPHLCFVDADVRLGPFAVSSAVRALRELDSDVAGRAPAGLLTVWPRQVAGSLTEALVQPLLCWSWFATVPLSLTERQLRPSTAVANGQFLVTRRSRYTRVGGHRQVAGSLTDDLALARAFRRAGFTTAVRAGRDHVRCRMYDDAADLRSGYRRWLASEFGGIRGAITIAGLAVTGYAAPAVLLMTGPRRPIAATALTMAAASRVVARHREVGRVGLSDVAAALTHPVAVVVAASLVAESASHTRRRTLSWKGRPVDTPT